MPRDLRNERAIGLQWANSLSEIKHIAPAPKRRRTWLQRLRIRILGAFLRPKGRG